MSNARDQLAAGVPGRSLPQVELSIVLPVRDAGLTIANTLERLGYWAQRTQRLTEVVVVDDGSTDSTDEAARLSRRLFDGFQVCRHERRRGPGAAVRTGVLAARGRYVLVADRGAELLPGNARTLLDCLTPGADVVVTSRRGGSTPSERPFLERAAETTFLAVSRLFVTTGVRDGLSGLVALRQGAGQRIAERAQVDGPAFVMEWLAVARTFGLHVAECPLAMAEASSTTSLLSPGTAPGMLKDIWKTHRRLAGEEYAGAARPRSDLLEQTSFVRLDRTALSAAAARRSR